MTTAEFGGVIGQDWRDSEPWWAPEPTPPPGAPNVALIVLDDVGYAQLGCYGSDIDTPTLDRLAAGGVRLANFHTTALCSPTRSCLLTGRNHHVNGMGRVADLAMGFPGYCGRIPRENGFLSEVLGARGYASYAVGKWHLTPDDETHMGASRSSWPLGRGFQRWYGFHGGETHQFAPALYHDNHSVAPPGTYEDGYHLSADLADRAIGFLGDYRSVDTERPWFLYFATGACHSPHHAPADWIERYRGRFDRGWDAWREATFARQHELGLLPPETRLSPRPPWVPAWDELGDGEREVAARFMECFAAYLSYTDAQIGRLIDFIDELGELDDTLIVVVSDNGASAEGGRDGSINDARLVNLDPARPRELRERIDEIGGPSAHNNYPWGWTMAGNTPFRRWKREVHEGGVADPCIVHWPARLGSSAGGIRGQFAHAVDVMPTVLELAGLEWPDEIGHVPQAPVAGTSFAYLLGADGDAEPERHETQYFEMLGSRALYHQGWKAVTFKALAPMYDDSDDWLRPFDDDHWELYHVAEDLSETEDLAEAEPDRLAEMVERWWDEARRNQVLPLDNRILHTILNPRPSPVQDRSTYRYLPWGSPVPEPVAVDVRNRAHAIVVDVTIPEGGADGVLLAMGTVLGGWSLHVLDGRPRYVHNLYGKERHAVESDAELVPGRHRIVYEFEKTGENAGRGTLRCDDVAVGSGDIPRFTPSQFTYTGSGLTCGYEMGPAIGLGYAAPFRFAGEIHRATVEVIGRPAPNPLAQFEAIMSTQ
jgi:arylsulfatase